MIGMHYKILPTREFSKDFQKLEQEIKERIRRKVEEVAIDPTRYKHLHYNLKGSSRLYRKIKNNFLV